MLSFDGVIDLSQLSKTNNEFGFGRDGRQQFNGVQPGLILSTHAGFCQFEYQPVLLADG